MYATYYFYSDSNNSHGKSKEKMKSDDSVENKEFRMRDRVVRKIWSSTMNSCTSL